MSDLVNYGRKSVSAPNPGDPAKSQNDFYRLEDPSNSAKAGREQDAYDATTSEARRYGNGYAPKSEGHPMGGQNLDSRNQYTVKPKRGSSF